MSSMVIHFILVFLRNRTHFPFSTPVCVKTHLLVGELKRHSSPISSAAWKRKKR